MMDVPQTLTLKDVLTLMIVMSDNTATNLAIDRLGLDKINAHTRALGLKDTYLYKKVFRPPVAPFPADQRRFGLGKTTAREMALVIEKIGLCQLGTAARPAAPSDTALCDVALGMLRNQFYRDGIPRYLEGLDSSETGSAIANKTGAVDEARGDVALVAAKSGLIVISAFTYDNADHSYSSDDEGDVTIAKLGKAIMSKHGRRMGWMYLPLRRRGVRVMRSLRHNRMSEEPSRISLRRVRSGGSGQSPRIKLDEC